MKTALTNFLAWLINQTQNIIFSFLREATDFETSWTELQLRDNLQTTRRNIINIKCNKDKKKTKWKVIGNTSFCHCSLFFYSQIIENPSKLIRLEFTVVLTKGINWRNFNTIEEIKNYLIHHAKIVNCLSKIYGQGNMKKNLSIGDSPFYKTKPLSAFYLLSMQKRTMFIFLFL